MTPIVKKLVWVKQGEADHHGLTTYDCGPYRIDWKGWKENDSPTLWRNDPEEWVSSYDTLELAQAAAQADYSARITTALDPAWLATLEAQVKAADGLAEAWADFDKPLLTFSSFGAMRETARHFVATYRAAKEASHE